MEIVIENPSESQSVTPSAATGHVTVAAAAAAAAAVSAMSETGTITRSPRPLSCTIEDFNDGNTMRRVDRSGLLEISSIDHPSSSSSSSSTSSSRFRHCRPIGAESSIAGHAGTLPRRVDRSGLLEALPELPENNRRSSDELLRTPYNVQEVTMIKPPDVVALVRSPTINYDSSTRFSNPSPSLLRPTKSPSPGTTSTSTNTINNTTTATTSRMSPTANITRRADGDSGLPNERSIRFSSSTETFIPIESSLGLSRERYSYKDSPNFTSNSRNEIDNNEIVKMDSTRDKEINNDDRKETNSELSLLSSSKIDVNVNDDDKNDENDDNDVVPRGERAEAEGCENTTNENLEEGRVSFNNTTNNKLYHNDNVQTLTVIILSEQL
ncbi:uncharacterized protein DDB_G0271670-like [Polistes fuscatus]|uniref:uncharacterized protein DDB_G0271670-like n=1 Tax=Polistes fuscatus TaxID=30207 RepID=UPI001CA925A4|nr:uncharacterized protein DDB_G0271670-like [Polistes fuscatus]